MPASIHILAACKNPEILATLIRLIDKQETWQVIGVQSLAEAQHICPKHSFDLALIGSGFNPEEEQQLRDIISESSPHTRVVEHYGGGSGLLLSEIQLALA